MRSARLVSGPNSEWSPWAHRASATAAFQPGPDWTGSDSSSGGASGAGQSWMLEKCQPEPARPGQGLRHGRGVREGQEGQEGFRPGCRAERQVQTGDARAPRGGDEGGPALLGWGHLSSFSASHRVPARLTVSSAEANRRGNFTERQSCRPSMSGLLEVEPPEGRGRRGRETGDGLSAF